MNGSFVGYSEDTFTPSEFELTPFVKEVKINLLHRYLNGQAAAGVKTRTFSVSQEFTVMFIYIPCRKFMYRI